MFCRATQEVTNEIVGVSLTVLVAVTNMALQAHYLAGRSCRVAALTESVAMQGCTAQCREEDCDAVTEESLLLSCLI